MVKRCVLLLSCIFVLLPVSTVGADPYNLLPVHTLGGGNGGSANASFAVKGTLGQTIAGQAASGSHSLQAGFPYRSSASTTERTAVGLAALYKFREGGGTTVHDVSGVDPPMHLTIQSEAAVTWFAGGGLSVDSSTIIESAAAASKIIDAVKASNAITVEAWVNPANTSQDGPARIVSLSWDPYDRNFTLGQSQDTYDMRLRTTSTSNNGMPSLTTTAGALTTNLTHIVSTRKAGGDRYIYIDGVEVASGTVAGNFSGWNEDYKFALANEFVDDRTWLGEIYLVAVYSRALTPTEITQNFNAGPMPTSADQDVDSDGLADGWELTHFGNLEFNGQSDPDGDQLTNLEEFQIGLDPNDGVADTDADNLPDRWELDYIGNLDSGPSDDSDADGIINYLEFKMGHDPLDLNDRPAPGNYYEYDRLGRIKKIVRIPAQ